VFSGGFAKNVLFNVIKDLRRYRVRGGGWRGGLKGLLRSRFRSRFRG
jgi:hypothetical protein